MKLQEEAAKAQQPQTPPTEQGAPSPFPGGGGFDPSQGGEPPIQATGDPGLGGQLPDGSDAPA
jgi:hypothetical protein